MPKTTPTVGVESLGFYLSREIITACERLGLPRQQPFTPVVAGKFTKAKRELLLLQKGAVDTIALLKMEGMVVPYVLDEKQDVWNEEWKKRKASRD